MNFGPVTDRRKATHMSPPCTGTGGLKKGVVKTMFAVLYSVDKLQKQLEEVDTL